MELLKQGQRVVVLGTDVKAVITGLSSKGETCLMYERAWWTSGSRKEEWVYSFEIEPYIDNSKPAGFKNYDNKQTLIE
jgi:hypothetical protein